MLKNLLRHPKTGGAKLQIIYYQAVMFLVKIEWRSQEKIPQIFSKSFKSFYLIWSDLLDFCPEGALQCTNILRVLSIYGLALNDMGLLCFTPHI